MKDVLSEGWDNCVSHARDTAIDQIHEPHHKHWRLITGTQAWHRCISPVAGGMPWYEYRICITDMVKELNHVLDMCVTAQRVCHVTMVSWSIDVGAMPRHVTHSRDA